MKILKTFLLISSIIFVITLLVPPVKAALPSLDTGETGHYCDRATGIYYNKDNCTIAPEKAQFCTVNNCSTSDVVWSCIYTSTGQSCTPSTGALTGPESIIGFIQAPPQVSSIGYGSAGISTFLSNIISLIYLVAGIVFLFMIVISAAQWILSGGDKEAVAKARGRITWAIVGIVVLSLAFVFLRILEAITGFTFFSI